MEDTENAAIAAAKEKLLAEYKVKYGVLGTAEAIDTDGTIKTVYFKKPSRAAIGIYLALKDRNVVEAFEAIYMSAVVKEISDAQYFFENDDAFYGIMFKLTELIEVKKSTFTSL
jgi:hypothetical protein